MGPKTIRESGNLLNVLKQQESLVDIKDFGDIKYNPITTSKDADNLKNIADVAGVNKVLSDTVFQVLNDGRFCLTLGGDHSIGIGMF